MQPEAGQPKGLEGIGGTQDVQPPSQAIGHVGPHSLFTAREKQLFQALVLPAFYHKEL
jgi:hypothetical protein